MCVGSTNQHRSGQGGITFPPLASPRSVKKFASEGFMGKQVSKKRTPPFSIRLSDDERAEIVRRSHAAGLSIAGYFKSVALNQRPRKFRHPQVDRAELARLLGQLGRVGNNLNQLARTLNTEGSVEIPELTQALNDLSAMRAMVMSALGYRETTKETGNDKQGHHHDY